MLRAPLGAMRAILSFLLSRSSFSAEVLEERHEVLLLSAVARFYGSVMGYSRRTFKLSPLFPSQQGCWDTSTVGL